MRTETYQPNRLFSPRAIPRLVPVRVTRHTSPRAFAREVVSRRRRGYVLAAAGFENRCYVAHWSVAVVTDRDFGTEGV